ncbi:MAG: chemotaxis protein CheW [Bdellovibrionales bacterium RIFOXYC1_FULL_54_43]|nr:MAG: chemotaxis protein CheW [Bdellovibrionales bacterium RIFOXYC1_FULL_54_43]OFZ81677.1 MAG: chemotaxis protein CheW [Bdellovibrionales bacterium RIFOXYD1_FULL_55_31]
MHSDVQKPGGKVERRAGSGKYLTFRLAAEEYGLEILKVQEIIGIMNVTRVPKMPAFVRGIINLRGKLIPVIDMRAKFGMPHQDDTLKTCIIVVQVVLNTIKITMGVIVDNVSEVLNIQENQIEAPPAFGAGIDTEFMLGMGKVGNKVVILLDIDRVLTGSEASQILATVAESAANPEQKDLKTEITAKAG